MILKIKKISWTITVLAISCMVNASPIHEKFMSGYEFFPSQASTQKKELPMSFYKGGKVVFFRGDSAYIATIGEELDLTKIELCKELCGMGIEGTFAYDEKNKTLYFAKSDKSGNSDLYEAKWDKSSFGKPALLSIEGLNEIRKPIKGSSAVSAGWTYRYNRPSGFYNPTIAKNGDRIYFSADFPKKGYGKRDIWYIDKNKDKKSDIKWQMPVNVGDSTIKFNSASNDDYPWTVGDTLMYFASNRPGGMGGLDLYVSRLLMDTVTTVDTLGKTTVNIREIWDTPELLDSTFNTSANEYNLIGNQKLVLFMSDRAGGKGSDDIYRPYLYSVTGEPELTPDMMIEEPKDFQWVLFFFDFNKSDMKPEYQVQVDELVEAMNEFPGASFVVDGHTDTRGSEEYNMKLSQKRAEYVRQMLIDRGLDPNKLKAKGFGKSQPLIPNAESEEEHEQNRRVQITIIDESN